MRILLGVIVVLGLGWSAYWFVGALAMERAMVDWVADRRADGWQADYTALDTRGFPNRFDTTFRDLQLADPESGLAWTAPFFQILSLSYRPTHVIAVLPDSHRLASPVETIELGSSDARGSLVLDASTLLGLNRTSFVIADFSAASSNGWSLAARDMRIAARRAAGTTTTYDLAVGGTGVTPGGTLTSIAQEVGLPEEIGELTLEATITFDAPWDLRAIEDARPQPKTVELKKLRAEWGELLLQSAGTLVVDEDGVPTGSLAVQARNWRDIVRLGVTTGAIPERAVPTIERGLKFVAGLSGNPDHIDATINFRSGLMALGPLPIGPAPTLRLR